MKFWICAVVLVVGAWHVRAAEERFSGAVRSEDFAAAGLTKLSAEELARLDALVRDYKSGALAAARRELAAAQQKAAQAEAAAREADAKAAAKARAAAADTKASPSLLDRAKVLLTPGTKVEYSTLETRLAGNFTGWERNTVFTLENGQRWRVTSSEPYVTPPMPPMKVKIVPGALGTFWMEFEGVRQRARVEAL